MEQHHLNCSAELVKYHPKHSDSGGAVGIGVVFLVGLTVSFMPQIYNITKRKSARGISFLFTLCSSSMATSNCSAAALLQRSKFDCCSTWGFRQCNEQLLPVYALIMQALCTTTIFSLTLGFSWRDCSRGRDDSSVKPEYKVAALRLGLLFWILFSAAQISIACAFVHLYRQQDNQSTIDYLGKVLGVISTVFTLVQYIPQIRTTYKLKGLGSFSAATLVIQSLGGIGFGLDLAFAGQQTATTFMPPLVTGTFQIVVLSMAIYYKKMGYTPVPVSGTECDSPKGSLSHEHDPLLQQSVNSK